MRSERERDALETADEEARHAAQTCFDAPIVLEAGAGTGKTAVLVARIVCWCIDPGWQRSLERARQLTGRESPANTARDVLERVVALTFTERAAAEMGQRVAEAFTRLADGETFAGFAEQRLSIGAAERRRRARALSAAAEHMRVSTIHGFCRQLLAQFALEGAVHPAFEVDGDGRAVALVVEELLADRLADAYGAAADPRYEELAVLGIGPAQLADALGRLLAEGVPAEAIAWDPCAREQVLRSALRLRRNIELLLEAMGEIRGRGRAAAMHAQSAVRLLLGGLRDVDDVDGLLALVDEDDLPRLTETLARWGKSRFGSSEEECFGARCEAISAASLSLRAQLENLRRVKPRGLRLALEILAELAEQARERMRRRGVVTFPDLLRLTERLLAARPEVQRRLRAQLDQLLVDEFQDTDPLQCSILRLVALEGDATERPGLFLVGDPKQSIYGWRNADMAAYENFIDRVQRLGGRRFALTRNFRSVPAILGEVERIVAPIMRAARGLQAEFQPLVAMQQDREGEPHVAVEHWIACELERPDSGDLTQQTTREGMTVQRARELEAKALARDLLRMHEQHDIAWREMAVLMRTMTQQEAYLAALRGADVPYVVERDRQYYRRREVIDASALLRAVLDPADELALVTFLRSVVAGVPDDALLALASAGFLRSMARVDGVDAQAVEAARAQVAAVAGACGQKDAGWALALGEAVSAVEALRAMRSWAPVDQLVQATRESLPLELAEGARHLGAHRLSRLQRFFGGAVAALMDGGGAEALLRRLRLAVSGLAEQEDTGADDEAAEAVRVMSIHKAKGLTFDCVYLVGTHSAGRETDVGSRVDWGCLPDGTWELRLFGNTSLGFDLLRQRRASLEQAEAVRTLYVALTRPRRRLVVSGRWPLGGESEQSTPMTHADLLLRRAGQRPDLAELRRAAAQSGQTRIAGCYGEDWVILLEDEQKAPESVGAQGPAERHPDDEAAQYSEPAVVWKARALAATRMGETVVEPVTTARSDPGVSRSGAAATDGSIRRAAPDAARVAGSVVHRALETLDFASEIAPQLCLQKARLRSYAEEGVTAETLRDALRSAEETVDRLIVATEIPRRMAAIGCAELGREVPILLAGDAGATQVGTIDLLYRDRDGQLVIVDYKTDRVRTDDDLGRYARRFEPQGSAYGRAVERAFAQQQQPRFEVWFLWADRTIPLDA